MTVVASAAVVQGPVPGWGDTAGLPAGIWVVDVSVTGDPSGGIRIASGIFASSGQSNPRFYSLEQFFLVDTLNSTSAVDILTSGMGTRRTGGPGPFGMQAATNAGVSFARLPGDELQYFSGIFLGRQSDRGVLADFSVSMVNSDTNLLRFAAAGYVWDSQAMGAMGGLRRPPGPWKR